MNVLFLGSSHFSSVVLSKMLESGVNVVGIITQPDRPSGRGHKMTPTEVKVMGQEKGIEVYTFDRLKNHQEEIEKIDFDISVVASFGQILPQWFLDLKLCINVHPSLLPKYRGASPIQNALLNGDEVTGVTIMKVAMEVDAGDIILQKEYTLADEYYLELEEKLGILGGEMASQVIAQAKDGNISFTPQKHENAVHVQKFEKEDGHLDFSQSAKALENRVRALSETVGCFFIVKETPIKIVKAKAVEENVEEGRVLENKKRFVVGCGEGALEILECKAPSGKTVRGQDFLNGHNEILGEKAK